MPEADIIDRIAQEYGNRDDLVGHIGGDDFVVITTSDHHEVIAHQVIEQFDRRIIDLYDRLSLEQGYIIASNRQGQKSQLPIMTVSIAGVIINNNNTLKSHFQVGEVAAEIKNIAKARKGSCYYFENL